MYDLIICVYACNTKEKYINQIMQINKTWGKLCINNIKLLYFLEENGNLHGNNYIHLKGVTDDYLSASYKQLLGLKYIYMNYKTKFIFCCGSDTFINIYKLKNLLLTYNYLDNLYIGGHGDYRIIDNKNYYFHSGGPGIIITNTTLAKLYKNNLDNIIDKWTTICINNSILSLIPACDVALSYFLQQLEINSTIKTIYNFQMLHCNYKGIVNNKLCCGDNVNYKDIISCHNMSLDDFIVFNNILKKNNYFI